MEQVAETQALTLHQVLVIGVDHNDRYITKRGPEGKNAIFLNVFSLHVQAQVEMKPTETSFKYCI